MQFADRIIDNIDSLLYFIRSSIFRGSPRDLLNLFTTEDDFTFVTKDGTMVTLFRVKGITSKMYPNELKTVIYELAELLGNDLISKGAHDISIGFQYDPDIAYEYARDSLAATRETAERLGLGEMISLLMEEKARKMAEFCQVESCYLAVTTTPKAIHKKDIGEQLRTRGDALRTWPETAEALLNDYAFPELRTKHGAMVKSLIRQLKSLQSMGSGGFLLEAMSVKDYLKEIKTVTDFGCSDNWKPRVAEDIFQDIRVPNTKKDLKGKTFDWTMPPTLGEQLFSRIPETIGLRYAVMGNRIYYSTAVSVGPTAPETFDHLIEYAGSLRVPFRINFSLTNGGLGVNQINSTLANTFPWASSTNTRVKNAQKALDEYERHGGGVVPALYITASTWAPAKGKMNKQRELTYDLEEIEQRQTRLNRVIQSWGGAQTTDAFAAPIEGVLGSLPAVYEKPLGNVMAPTMPDAIGLSPLFRGTTSWGKYDGNVLLRQGDGRFLHYQQTSSQQNAWVTLMVGPMGFSKSTTLNTMNLMYLINPSAEPELPFLRCLDVGPSSRAIIDIIQESLGKEREHIAQYIRLQNTKDYQFNPFDTPLGINRPLQSQITFLVNLVSTICYSMVTDDAMAGRLPGLVTSAINRLYKMYGPKEEGGDRPREFYERANPLVSSKVKQYGIEVDEMTTWFEIRDLLFEKGEVRAALIAHRKAMPILSDFISVASSEEMRSDYPDIVDGTPLLDLFSRSIREAAEMFPMLQGETKFELGQSRVISLDMEDVIPKDNSPRSLWQASVAFFIGYEILTRDFFFHRDHLSSVPRMYHQYHERRVRRVETARKRFSMDERQRFSAVSAAQSQVDSLIAEGRKNKVDIMVASQLFNDHTPKSIELSSTIMILGAGNMTPEEAENIRTRFELTEQQMKTIRRIRPPSPKGAEAFCIFKTRDGNQAHHCYLSEGSIYLWAIATEAEDRSIRRRMYELFSTTEALQRLAKRFPGGSIKKEMEAIQAKSSLDGGGDNAVKGEEIMENFIRQCADLKL